MEEGEVLRGHATIPNTDPSVSRQSAMRTSNHSNPQSSQLISHGPSQPQPQLQPQQQPVSSSSTSTSSSNCISVQADRLAHSIVEAVLRPVGLTGKKEKDNAESLSIHFTLGQNNLTLGHKLHIPTSLAVSELAQWSARAKREVASKQTSEWLGVVYIR